MPENVTVPTEEQRRSRLTGRLARIGIGVALVTIGSYIPLYLQLRAWQFLGAIGIITLAIFCLIPVPRLGRRGKFEVAGYWMLLATFVGHGCGELLWAGATLYIALGGILLFFLIGIFIRPRRWGLWVAAGAAYLAFVLLVNRFQPLPRYDIAQSPALNSFLPFITALLVLLTLWQVARAFQIGTIRTRLLIAFSTVVALPVLVIGSGTVISGLTTDQQKTLARLESVATLKEAELRGWTESLKLELALTLSSDDDIWRAVTLLQSAEPSTSVLGYGVKNRLEKVLKESAHFEELFLLDREGTVVLSTIPGQAGAVYRDTAYFQKGLQGPYIEPPVYSPSLRKMSVVVVRPIADFEGRVVGVLGGRATLDRLDRIMEERAGLENTGETYLVGANHLLLTANRFGEKGIRAYTEGINRAVEEQIAGSATYTNYRNVPVLGAYRWLPELQVGLVAEQERGEAFRRTYRTLGILGGAALLAVLLAVGTALFITRSLSTPLAALAQTATQIAGGDLTKTAPVVSQDEIGTLATAFNSMTAQLRGLIAGLEQRVADRTQELARRSTYLEASAEVGRAVSSILDTEQLIRQVVELIKDRFRLYYVGLFLVDESGRWAVLRAGTGPAGQAMLARGHRLEVGGQSMIGWCIANAQPRVALEAGQEAVRLATAELPDTRSEAALPLRSRGGVIGALTVQHTQAGAFDPDTLAVLQTMADQVAVALDNARLFAERQQALEMAQRAYGELSREAWTELLQAQPVSGYRSTEYGIASAGDVWRPEMEQALQQGQTIRGDGDISDGKRPLAVPIRVRGQIVGVLDTYKPAQAGDWTADEVALLEAIAAQLDSALESARLYQETQRRALREQAIRQVTDRMRRAVDVEMILHNTVAELARVLGAPRAYVRLGTGATMPPGEGNEPPAHPPVEGAPEREGGGPDAWK